MPNEALENGSLGRRVSNRHSKILPATNVHLSVASPTNTAGNVHTTSFTVTLTKSAGGENSSERATHSGGRRRRSRRREGRAGLARGALAVRYPFCFCLVYCSSSRCRRCRRRRGRRCRRGRSRRRRRRRVLPWPRWRRMVRGHTARHTIPGCPLHFPSAVLLCAT